KGDVAEKRKGNGRGLGGPDEIRAQEHAHIGGHDEVVIAKLASLRCALHERSLALCSKENTTICNNAGAAIFPVADWRKRSHQGRWRSCTYVLHICKHRNYGAGQTLKHVG